ncbi:MAG TPA: hypothetical protein VID47_05145, partial [Actinomycetota bacterium]
QGRREEILDAVGAIERPGQVARLLTAMRADVVAPQDATANADASDGRSGDGPDPAPAGPDHAPAATGIAAPVPAS